MNWSLRIGRLLGIPLYIHWTFSILLAWILIARLASGATLPEALGTIAFVLALFGCVVLHEMGHAVTARMFGVGTRDITLLPIGGVARLERMPEEPVRELVIALAGPAVNVVIAAGLLGWRSALGGVGDLDTADLTGGNTLDLLIYANIALVVFNLLPAFPMDGGRALRALLAIKLDYVAATRIAANIGIVMAIIFGLVGLLINPLLILIALFVALGAQAEARHAEVRYLMQGVPVREAMMTRFRTLAPEATLADAVEALLEGSQQDFPVVESGRTLGLLLRVDLLRALAIRPGGEDAGNGEPRDGAGTMVRDVMRPDPPVVHEGDMLDRAHARMQDSGLSALPVLRGSQLVGLITLENVGEWMMVRSAAEGRRR
jgi:Zn-dependent protease/predicted transcriptional regulator